MSAAATVLMRTRLCGTDAHLFTAHMLCAPATHEQSRQGVYRAAMHASNPRAARGAVRRLHRRLPGNSTAAGPTAAGESGTPRHWRPGASSTSLCGMCRTAASWIPLLRAGRPRAINGWQKGRPLPDGTSGGTSRIYRMIRDTSLQSVPHSPKPKPVIVAEHETHAG